MTLPLPDRFVGGPLAGEVTNLTDLNERLASIQQNFEAIAKVFPVKAPDVDLDKRQSKANPAQALTTSFVDVAANLPVRVAGVYVVHAHFEFDVTGAGVGNCEGGIKVGASTENVLAVWGPASTGRATVSSVNYMTAAAGDEIFWRVRKTINAGTASLENAAFTYFGPI